MGLFWCISIPLVSFYVCLILKVVCILFQLQVISLSTSYVYFLNCKFNLTFQYSFNPIISGRHNLTRVYIIHAANLQTPKVIMYFSTRQTIHGEVLVTVLLQIHVVYLLVKITKIASTTVSITTVPRWRVNVSYSRNVKGVHELKWKKNHKHKTLMEKQKQV